MTGPFLKDLMHRVGSLAATEADAPADGDLLARFLRDRDEATFAGLLARHAPLVWGVCRGLLPCDADAEDAFQATWLALVRGAKAVRTPHSLAPWLHATTTRIAKKARLSTVRRAARDRTAARSDANGAAVPDSTWDVAFLAVHEEIARLPEAMRSAFVLCVLEGDRHADAATKLGVPIGTLSARVSRARDRLMEKLTARGLAPASAAAVLAFGGSAGPAAVPTSLIQTTCSILVAGATTAPASILNLATTATEGSVMKTKLLAAGVMIAAGFALTGGGMQFHRAEAQAQPPALRPADTATSRTAFPPDVSRWEYRFENNTQMFGEFEKLLKSLGNDGWEYVGSEVFANQETRKAVFKRLVTAAPTASVAYLSNSGTVVDANELNVFRQMAIQPSPPSSGTTLKFTDRNAAIRVESDKAAELAAVLSEAFNGPGKKDGRISVTADAAAKQVVIRCSTADVATFIQLVARGGQPNRIEM